ncbi:MAG: hypothetical protein OEY67_06255 [Gammaproteobacteria bacterium]|nr:hypothetical protein [Gammaproteobacteria bacterium]
MQLPEITNEVLGSPKKLTPAVLQVAHMLGMYHAELARVLGLNCTDIGEFTSIRKFLQPGTHAWQQAVLFIRFYQSLYLLMRGEESAMCHWLRAGSCELNGVPLLLIVDDQQLSVVLEYLQSRLPGCETG